jgi:hypothetical protein
LWRRVRNFFDGRRFDAWVADIPGDPGGKRRLIGLATIENEWARPNELAIRVVADWRGKLEQTLLSILFAQVKRGRTGRLRIGHLAHDEVMNRLLKEANFAIKRSLRVMRYELNKRG